MTGVRPGRRPGREAGGMAPPKARPAASAPWWVQKRKGVLWFGAALAGCAAGHSLAVSPWSWAALAAVALGGLIAGRRRGGLRWSALFLACLACVAALSISAGEAEYARRELDYPRGERRLLRGRVVDVVPQSGGRLALLVVDGEQAAPPPGRGPYWVRLVGTAEDFLVMVDSLPPGAGGTIAWPVRVYPFSPRGNPGEFDARLWAMRRGYVASAYVDPAGIEAARAPAPQAPAAAGREVESEGEGSAGDPGAAPCAQSLAALRLYEAFGIGAPLRKTAWRWRCRLARAADPGAGALAVAMLLGQKDLIGPDLEEAFSRSGLGHLLAVSGLHVGFIVALSMPFIARVRGRRNTGQTPVERARRWLAVLLLAAIVLAYVLLTGGPASAARAGFMALAGFLARHLGRPVDSWQVLGAAGALLLVYEPFFALDLGFQMSFLAVAGILCAAKIGSPAGAGAAVSAAGAEGVWVRARRWLSAGLRASLGAQIATAPLVAAVFSEVSWIAPAVNLAAVPAGGAGVMMLAAGLLLSELWEPLGALPIAAGHRLVSFVATLARAVAPWGALEVAMPPPLAVCGWYLGWFGAALVFRSVRRPAVPSLLRLGKRALIAGVLLAAAGFSEPAVKGLLGVTEVWVLDVGQGDAVLIRSAAGRTVMIDGGGVPGAAAAGGYDVGDRRVVPALKRLGVRRLDAVINSHPHEDHVHGLAAVIAQREVKAVFAAEDGQNAAYRMFVHAAAQKGLSVERLRPGQTFALGPGVSLTVLAAGAGEAFGTGSGRSPSVNDRSAVLLLNHRGRRALFAGDIEELGQRLLLKLEAGRAEPALKGVDLLLVPHHGDAASAVTGFLEAARPKVAVISVGPNRYGHPALHVIQKLRALGAQVWRTDARGAVRIEFWPWGMRIRSVR